MIFIFHLNLYTLLLCSEKQVTFNVRIFPLKAKNPWF